MVTDLHDAKLDKRQRRTLQRLDDPPEYSSDGVAGKISRNQLLKIQNPCLKILKSMNGQLHSFEKTQFKVTEPENIITLPSNYSQNTKVSNANSFPNKNYITSSFLTQLSDPTQ